MKEIKTAAEIGSIEAVTAFVDEYLEEHDCPMKAQLQLDVVIDELFSNIARYAYGDGTGDALVRVDAADEVITLSFEDSGIPFNPLEQQDPDVTLSAEEREIGGLGIFMVRKMTDDLRYEYRDGKNILTVIKKFR